MRPMYKRLVATVVAAAFNFTCAPASALERLVLRMPFLETTVSINLGDVETAAELIRSSPDLEDLFRASDGKLLSLIESIFLMPLPAEAKSLIQGSSGQPLLEQALFAAAQLVDLKGVEQNPNSRILSDALIRAERNGQSNILGLLREIPGTEVSIDLSKLATVALRLKSNQEDGVTLAKAGTAALPSFRFKTTQQGQWTRTEKRFAVRHRAQPLRLLILKPDPGTANGRLVVISHGLWDDPESFEGWGEFLAANGYTVLMPDHPGSNSTQQQAMLAGDRPPPGPEELQLRPLDITSILDGVRDGQLLSAAGLDSESIAVIGHSWGGTTGLQLAGAFPTDRKLNRRCQNYQDQERNLSWVLQCSWLSGIRQAAAADNRVKAVVALSPPLRLLFDPTSSKSVGANVLLVSGTRDWVVPSGPEALNPMRETGAVRDGHRLVLVEGGSHFNLRSFSGETKPPVVGPLILAWLNEQLAVDQALTFSGGGWGDPSLRLIDVSNSL